jgi:nitrogen fixation NifU-like protein
MSDLRELYQTTILDHNKNPRNFGRLESANREARGDNPLCGDKITVYLTLDGDTITDLAFEGSGCAISKASASMMTERLKGKPLAEAESLFEEFHGLVTSDPTEPPLIEGLGKLAIFAGVREFPMRVKCATLAWHTLRAAVAGEAEPVKTE